MHILEPNGVRVLRLVRDHGTISRIEIAKETGLHKSTITDLVARLIDAGFLEDTGELGASRKGGRKRRLLQFLPLARLVAGVDIRMTYAAVTITDLNAHVIAHDSFAYDAGDSIDKVLSRVAATIRNLVRASGSALSKLVGVGIVIQGIVDCPTNTLVLSRNQASWQGKSLGARLEREFRIPVYAENDVKAMALGEYLFGAARGTKDFIHVWIGEGIEAGIMINGQLVHGITSGAGEIDSNALHSAAVDSQSFPLTFRGQRVFGEILNDANLIESYRRHSGNDHGEEVTVPFVMERSRLGDKVAQRVLEEFVSLLNLLCTPMVNMLNPELIVIGGKLAESLPAVAEILQDKIYRSVLTLPARAVHVRCAANAGTGVILGAAGLVLYELFEPKQRISARAVRTEDAAKRLQLALSERVKIGHDEGAYRYSRQLAL
jgi:predicted NBD/HSP70 family sugar kinase